MASMRFILKTLGDIRSECECGRKYGLPLGFILVYHPNIPILVIESEDREEGEVTPIYFCKITKEGVFLEYPNINWREVQYYFPPNQVIPLSQIKDQRGMPLHQLS